MLTFCNRYSIRVGRSENVSGPFKDKEGTDLRQGGGTIIYGSNHGLTYAPGGLGVLPGNNNRRDILYYHYLDTRIGFKHKVRNHNISSYWKQINNTFHSKLSWAGTISTTTTDGPLLARTTARMTRRTQRRPRRKTRIRTRPSQSQRTLLSPRLRVNGVMVMVLLLLLFMIHSAFTSVAFGYI